jgi:hypothetical protein
MFWIACVAILLAFQRHRTVIPSGVAVIVAAALYISLVCTTMQLIFGKRPVLAFGANVTRRIRASGGFWAENDGQLVSVDLITCPMLDVGDAEITPIVDRRIDNRYLLFVDSDESDAPLSLVASQPVLARHPRYGLCVINP